MKTIKHILLLLVLVSSSAFVNRTANVGGDRVLPNKAFTYGEKLTYRVHYGWINAASIVLEIDDEPKEINGRKTYNITGKGKTYRSFDWAYKVRDHFETYLDTISLAPLKYFKQQKEDNYEDVDLVFYDHTEGKIRGKKKDMDMPAYVQDVVSGVYYARTLDMTNAYVGQTFPLNVYMDQEIHDLKFKFLGKETIKSDLGKIECYKLRPQLVVDRVFEDEDDMTLWVSADANKIPVRVKAKMAVGSVKIDLVKHQGVRNPLTSLK